MAAQGRAYREISGLPDWISERRYYGRFYLSQGFSSNGKLSNNCGPTSLAVVLNLLLFQANLGTRPLESESITRHSQFWPWERLPAWLPKVGGATAPWGVANAFNRWARRLHLGWHAERKRNARRAHVLECLMTGRPVTALKIWPACGAHWINLVRYHPEKERLYFLDPNPYLEYLDEDKRLQSQSWEEFEADWTRRCWWSRLLGIHKELIIYNRID